MYVTISRDGESKQLGPYPDDKCAQAIAQKYIDRGWTVTVGPTAGRLALSVRRLRGVRTGVSAGNTTDRSWL